ncbi:uncharacterized protein [Nicotiana tomentosiformis]|uniref:uncharacterized protein n=1 Tax=Nicotiana tomentosiformis TaxID=4098 RepID=UPI00388CE1D9
MSVGYKPLKFDIFDGTGDLRAHLRAYCDKLVAVGRNEKLRMKLFITSLTGEALTWYTHQDPRNWREWQDMAEDFMNHFRFNTEITPDRFALVNFLKKPSESFQEYAHRWRSEAARAQPLLDDSELTKYFIRAQEGIYFKKRMGMMGQKFPELVQIGDFLEEGIKSGKGWRGLGIQDSPVDISMERESQDDGFCSGLITRSRGCYAYEDVNRGTSGREQIQRRNITNLEAT